MSWEEKLHLNLSDAVETVLSVDLNDSSLPQYYRLMESTVSQFIVNDNKSVVEATNKAAKESTGEILIYVSDDFNTPNTWGQLVIDEFAKYTGPTLIKVDDCLQPFQTKVLTIPMMNRELYNKLGYFWHPDFKSMFCDEQLYWKAEKLGALKFAPHLKFPHEHVSIGKAENDDTYRRSAANWEQGKAMFAKHKASGFTL